MKLRKNSSNIFTIFGTSIHETVQQYLNLMYEYTLRDADNLDLGVFFFSRLKENFNLNKTEDYIPCTMKELKEAYEDGLEILDYFKKHKSKYFKKRQYELLGIEKELLYPINDNVNFKGYLDLVFREKETNKILIVDIKTSFMGWNDNKKKSLAVRSQLIFYKKFYSKMFNIDIKNIDVLYLILKRKVYQNKDFDWPAPRTQKYSPPSSERTVNKYENMLIESVNKIFDENGERKNDVDLYPKNRSKESCKYCPYKNKECKKVKH